HTGRVTILRQGPALTFSRVGAWLEANLRESAAGLSAERRALVFGVFLGDKSGLTYEMKNALGLTGALDAFAVSGVHVGFIVLMALMVVGGGYRRRWPRFFVCLIMLIVYCSLTGASASVLRSSLMALILLAATLFDEQYDGVTALALAAFACLAFRPLWLFSAGFQLSFAAAAGAIILTPVFRQLMSPLPQLFREFFSVTFAATLAILPLISYYFYHISWLGWLLVPLLVLASGVTVMLSFAATIVAMISPAIAGIFLTAASYAMEAAYWVCAAWSKFSLTASITGAVAGWTVALFLALLFLMPWLQRRMKVWACWAVLLTILPLFTLLAPKSVDHQPTLPGPLTEIVFIDVGQGDCALVITPDKKTILIDGGGNAWSPGSVGEYSLLPYLKSRGVTRIDLMINSHPHADHTDGLLSVLTYVEVKRLIYTDIWQGDEYYAQLLSLAQDQEAELQACWAGDQIRIGDYIRLDFYYPTPDMEAAVEINDNNGSLVFELSCGDIDILFDGDIDGELLSQVCAAAGAESEIIKVPHHGSKSGYASDLAQLLESEVAIISVGRDNSYGHPAAKVVEYWQEHGEVYRTDYDGSVSLFTNGREYQILTYH
ncbi:MAG: DNA internalization-related competence protein ComEC/Rec2, partial [Clostridia bacterium]|nr:DNA internalization-related competence protein ComEC/Rec2 [Clostridia bacterium]